MNSSASANNRTPNIVVDRELLINWLSWAGAKLIAMPTERIKPREPKACWPDYATDVFQVLEFRRQIRVRVPAPNKDEIPIMEEILLFPNLCSFVGRRRVLHLRLLTNPVSGRPINSWEKTAARMNTSVDRAKRLHSAAINEVLFKLAPERANFVLQFFTDLNSIEF